MQIAIELPDDIAQRLTQTVHNLPQRALESLVVEAYRDELLTHAEVGRILNLPSRWAIDAFSRHQSRLIANACLLQPIEGLLEAIVLSD
jgi:Uncharacterised protein family (UPF0175)